MLCPPNVYPCANTRVMPNGATVVCKACKRRSDNADRKRRLVYETNASETVYFITLTYRRKRITYRDVQLYLKRCRKKIGKRYKFKFAAVEEYGEKNNRQHYHLLICAPKEARTRDFRKWRKGITHIATVKRKDKSKLTTYLLKMTNYIQKSPSTPKMSQRMGEGLLQFRSVAEILQAFPKARITKFRPPGMPRRGKDKKEMGYVLPRALRTSPQQEPSYALGIAREYAGDPEILALLPKKVVRKAALSTTGQQ